MALRNHLSSILKSPPANTHPAMLQISSYKGSPQEELSFFSLKAKKKQVWFSQRLNAPWVLAENTARGLSLDKLVLEHLEHKPGAILGTAHGVHTHWIP